MHWLQNIAVEIKIVLKTYIKLLKKSGKELNSAFTYYISLYVGINCWNLIADFDRQKYDVIIPFDNNHTKFPEIDRFWVVTELRCYAIEILDNSVRYCWWTNHVHQGNKLKSCRHKIVDKLPHN